MSLRTKLQSLANRLEEPMRSAFEQKSALVLNSGITSEENMLDALHNISLSSELRAAICWILLYFEEDVAVHALVTVLEMEQDFPVRKAACEVLSFFRTIQATPVYSRLMREDENIEIRRICAYALGQIADKSAAELLIQHLEIPSETPEVRAQIFESLAYLGAKRVVPTLVEALQDDSPEVRFWAAFALGHLGGRSEISALERVTLDHAVVENWWSVGKEAQDAIKYIQARINSKENNLPE